MPFSMLVCARVYVRMSACVCVKLDARVGRWNADCLLQLAVDRRRRSDRTTTAVDGGGDGVWRHGGRNIRRRRRRVRVADQRRRGD